MTTFLRSGLAAAAALAAVAAPIAVRAQTAESAESEALSRCVQLSTNGRDRILTARWLMGALGSAPQLQDMVQIDPQLKQQSDIGMAELFTRLLTVDCLGEAKAIFRRDNTGAGVRPAFEVLGQIAVQELFGNDMSSEGLGSYAQYLNDSDFEVLRD